MTRIDELTGATVTARTQGLSFQATVHRLGDSGWSLRVVRRSGSEQHARVVRGESCEAMAEAASVIVALALRRAAAEPSPAADDSASSRTDRAPLPSAVVPASVAMRPHAVSRSTLPAVPPAPRVLLRAEAGVDRSTLRDTATLFSVAGRQRLPKVFALEIVTTVLLPRMVTDEAKDVRASVSLATQGLRGCFSLEQDILVSSGCAVTEAGFVQAHAEPAARDKAGQAFWAAAGLRLGLEARVAGPLRLGVAAEALLPLLRPALSVRGDRVYSLNRVAERWWFGVGLDVP